jgi:hypothetical protein
LISFRVFEPVNLPTVRLTHRSRRVGLFLHHYIGGIRSAVHQSPGPEHGLRHRVAGARINMRASIVVMVQRTARAERGCGEDAMVLLRILKRFGRVVGQP